MWGRVVRTFSTYLGGAEYRVGVQLRMVPPKTQLDARILKCAIDRGILPATSQGAWPGRKQQRQGAREEAGERVAVFVTSLTGRLVRGWRGWGGGHALGMVRDGHVATCA